MGFVFYNWIKNLKIVFLQVQRCRMARLEWFILKYESGVEKQRVPGVFRNRDFFLFYIRHKRMWRGQWDLGMVQASRNRNNHISQSLPGWNLEDFRTKDFFFFWKYLFYRKLFGFYSFFLVLLPRSCDKFTNCSICNLSLLIVFAFYLEISIFMY